MSGKSIKYCSISGCPGNLKLEGRHVFRFPKEYDRWLQWIRRSGRLDLEEKGPEYSFRNCQLCSLHFEEKWFKISKRTILLHPDAIPTKFGKDLKSYEIIEIETDIEAEKEKEIEVQIQEQTSSTGEKGKEKIDESNEEISMDVEIVQPSTSCKITTAAKKKSLKKRSSATKEQLYKTIEKLKSKNKVLHQKNYDVFKRKKKKKREPPAKKLHIKNMRFFLISLVGL